MDALLTDIATAPDGEFWFWTGALIVAALLAEHDGAPAWLLANLGDSRAYRVEGGSLEQVTVDHSVVQELVEHLDAAGLDGHVRVLRVHDAVDA